MTTAVRNERQTVPTTDAPSVKILASEIYKWTATRCFVVGTAYGRIGDTHGGGTESSATTKPPMVSAPTSSIPRATSPSRRLSSGPASGRGGRAHPLHGNVQRGRVDRALPPRVDRRRRALAPVDGHDPDQDRMTASATRRHEEPTIMDLGTPTMSLSEHRAARSIAHWGGNPCR